VRKLLAVVAFVALIVGVSASAAFAGEITGNGTLKGVNPNASACANSGQEDLQWYTTDLDTTLKDNPTKGDPAHSQNWGHAKDSGIVVDSPLNHGASQVLVDLGLPSGPFLWGCNKHINAG
jgi:hypothetical protein